ncbi:MAG: Ig-like domain-containing protein, partial [Saprospiraceae bacterium]|nr:Ig-like domain-containing protein [Saprospiraceae bacterium]
MTLILSAQLNPRHIYVNEKIDVANQVEIQSLTFPPTVTNNGFPDSGKDSLSIYPVNGVANTYEVFFDPPADFTGDTEIIIEYFESGAIPGIPYPNYTTIHYRIKPSNVETNNDFFLDSKTTLSVFPLGNDSSTDGNLTIQKIGFVSGGTASIVSNDQIDFTFDSGSESGLIMYFVEDDFGTVESSIISIQNEDDLKTESRSVYLDNKTSETIELSSDLFEIDTDVTHGTLSIGNENHIWVYTPDDDFDGSDYARFTTTNGGDIEVFITVLDKSVEHSFVIDDEIHTVIDGSVDLNVFNNDLRTDFPIVDYSSELTYNGDGSFSYTPPSGFSGDLIFYYKVFSGIQFHTGNINIHVDNYAPAEALDYSFDIINNHPLKITHHSPVEAYTFSVLLTPLNGTVEVLDSSNSSVQECDTITGVNTIVYTPDADFNGNDEFELEYCTSSGACEVIKIDVHILDSNYDDCLCLNNCVYEGDNNDDGIVNAKDILDIGLNLGNGGLERTNDFNLLWTGQESDDWGYEQMNSNIDLKCGDSDGDGYIDGDDFEAVAD